MATFTAIRNKKQTKAALMGTLMYVLREDKISYDGRLMAGAEGCTVYTSYLEMLITKQTFGKTDGRQFYHFVQSFPDKDALTPEEANRIGLEFAAKQFPGFEVVVATHCDTDHLHNHFVVNSVSYQTGKKLHQSPETLRKHRKVNDEICAAHGLHVLEQEPKKQKKKRMKPGEYQAALRGESWKFELIRVINEALEYATDKESFIANMEYEGYEVNWSDTRKYITFTTPVGRKCRDRSLHDDTFLKENLERLFAYRQEIGFVPLTPEPPEGWLGELAEEAVQLGRELEQAQGAPPPIPLHGHADSKQRQREKLKKLALGQKPQDQQEYGQEL